MDIMDFGSRLKHAWNYLRSRDPTALNSRGRSSSQRPDRTRLSGSNEKSIITPILNQIAIDVARVDIRHCKTDSDGRFIEIVKSTLNECLSTEANIDQTGRAMIQDAALSLLDEGCIAIVPIDTDESDDINDPYKIESLRVGKIIKWNPDSVVVRAYNEYTGDTEDVPLPKKFVAIIENPFYAVMNQPNSILKRLVRKLNLLDVIDEQSGSGKLDLIVQVPYALKTDTLKARAESRRIEIEDQLANSKFGIAYADSTEKITQLNRPIDNNLMHQIEYLTSMLYSQLGITQSILDGSADEKTMLNYQMRSVNPVLTAIVEEMRRKFLTKTARTQGQTIMYFRNLFELVTASNLADIADKLTRNEIASSNEIRQLIGWKPSKDPAADELRNKNVAKPAAEEPKDNKNIEEVNSQNEV